MNDRDVAFDPTVATPASELDVGPKTGVRYRHQSLAERFVGQLVGGRYKLKRIVGAGGFGAVFEGEDQRIKKRVAVKLLFADLLRDREAVTRFKLEAEAASRVGHRNIIDITDFDFTEDDVAYMVMEFLEGEDLAHIIRRGDAPDLAQIVRICLQATRGLGAAHRKGIVHRDLKPGNIFVPCAGGEREQAKVVDFGISRASELDEDERLTKTGQILGTPYYMAPEQADGIREVDARADIYAMGIILFEGCTGKLPFMARTPIGLITKHASEPPPEPRSINPAIPALLENTILKCLEKNPADRFKDAAELEQALLYCLATLDPTLAAIEQAGASSTGRGQDRLLTDEALVALTTPSSVLRRSMVTQATSRRRPLVLAAVGLGALLVGILVTLWMLKRPGESQRPSPPAALLASMQPEDPKAGSAGGLADDPMGGADAASPAPDPMVKPSSPGSNEEAGTPPPRPTPVVELRCRSQQKDVRVTDEEDSVTYGICPGKLLVPQGLRPVKLYYRKTGFIPRTEEVLPDRGKELRFISLTPIRQAPMVRLPDDPIQ